MTYLRFPILIIAALVLPLATWAASVDIALEPASVATETGEQPTLSISGDDLALRCDRSNPIADEAAVDVYAAGCCWVFINGTWWCVPGC